MRRKASRFSACRFTPRTTTLLDAKGELVRRAHPGYWLREALLASASETPAGVDSPPTSAVEARVTWAGQAFGSAPSAWFRNEWENSVPEIATRWDAATSTLQLEDIPEGTYLVELSATGFVGTATFGVTDGETRQVDVRMSQLMRLTSPVDTALPQPELPVLRSPIRFTWDHVANATSYKVGIQRSRSGAEYDPTNERFLSRELTENSLEVALEGGWDHEFDLEATGPGGRIGHLEVRGSGYRAWAYRFRIK